MKQDTEKNKVELVEINGEKCLIQVIDCETAKALEDGEISLPTGLGALQYDETSTESGINYTVKDETIMIAPWGQQNDFPSILGNLVYQSTIVPALNNFNASQIWGKGPMLVDEFTREEIIDKEVWSWLKTWNYRKFLMQQIADFAFSENCFSEMILSVGATKGVEAGIQIASLAHLHNKDVRLELTDDNGVINNVVCGDFNHSRSTYNDKSFFKLPLFSYGKKMIDYKSPLIAFHSKRETANFPYYVYPQYTAVLEIWSPIATKIAQFHNAMLENSINAKWHIQISSEYIDRLLTESISKAKNKDVNTITFDSVYQELRKEVIEKMTQVMSGAENSGKFFVSPNGRDELGKEIDYVKITALDLKLKETSESHLKLYEQVISSITSAESVDTSLASVVSGSKMNSGSEMLNAHNIHQQVKTPIPREVICASINEAIRLNFPNKNVILTFRPIVLVQQQENKNGVKKGAENGN